MEKRIKVFVVDSNEIMRKGLVEILSKDPEMEIVGHTDQGEKVLRLVGELSPDVMLIDLRNEKMNGAQIVKKMHGTFPAVRCIIFTGYDEFDEQYIFDSINAGAQGYLLKTVPVEKLVEAIKTVHGGGSFLSPRVASKVFGKFRDLTRGRDPASSELSPREEEIVRLIAEGFSNKQIAARLYISTKTVKTHVANILEKLNVKNRTEAVVSAIRKGLIDCRELEPPSDFPHPDDPQGGESRSAQEA
jgi:DNA-binding NarL/FixJ family response regulator